MTKLVAQDRQRCQTLFLVDEKLTFGNGVKSLRRAAESIIEFAHKALEHEELEKRIEALEDKVLQQGGPR